LQCPDCGQVEVCPRCSVNVTYHRAVEQLRCHFCDYTAPAPKQCPQCASIGYRYSGMGTQKLEEAMDRELPKARLLRMDSDAMRGKRAYAEALSRFGRGEVDVLVGTQMIAKGLDFPQVTCVAVINVDGALQIPDFRGSERVFQQLMQVAGRAGRGDKGGEVFIQTKTPFHPAIQYARHHDYAGYVEQELEFRQALQYPPYRRVLLLKWRGRNEEKTLFVAGEVLKQVKEKLGDCAEVGEVAPAAIARIDHYFRFQSLILTTRVVECSRRLRGLVLDSEWPEGVQMGLDVDPLHLM
jgi:primosomal protein N' (replication factor Y) (superfamily II helicase)